MLFYQNQTRLMQFKIRHKMFLGLLLSSVIVVGGFFLALQWSFDHGFKKYVENMKEVQFEQLTKILIQHYQDEGDWDFLYDNSSAWFRINNENSASTFNPEASRLPLPVGARVPASEGSAASPPCYEPRGIWPRVILYDVNKDWVVGGAGREVGERHAEHVENIQRKEQGGKAFSKGQASREVWGGNFKLQPILLDGEIIGYLSMIPISSISLSRDLLFVKQQELSLAMVAGIMFLVSILLSFPLTLNFVRPIRDLAMGTRRLIGGKFNSRVPVRSEDELGQLARDFNSLAATLEQNEQARRQWVADISHELRTPLAVLRGEIEGMQDGIRKLDHQALEILHGEVMHLQRLTRDLYELSMSDAGALNYRKTEVEPFGILEGAVEVYTARYAAAGLDLSLKLPGYSPRVLADPDRLQQLFTNLLENGLRYTLSPGRMEVIAELTKKKLMLIFQDTAPGVTAEQLPHLFDRLYRVDTSRSRKKAGAQGAKYGAGLGLSICKNIVEAHEGGIIALPSTLGGLQLKISLPRVS